MFGLQIDEDYNNMVIERIKLRQTPESGIPPGSRYTKRYTKIHIDV